MARRKPSGKPEDGELPPFEAVSLKQLIPYARNARTHSDAQVGEIAASIREFGFMNPVLIDGKNNIIAGHGRVMAAEKLGMNQVPCVRADWLTETQRRAYVLADNRLADKAGWDRELLKVELSELRASDFDVSMVGWSDEELKRMFADDDEGGSDPELGNLEYRVLINCDSEEQQGRLIERLEKEGYTCSALIS